MKKPNSFNVMSDQTCSYKGCNRKIKQNVVDRKADGRPIRCKFHFWKDHPTLSHRATGQK